MADDARISTAFPNHHKTKKLEKRLGTAGAWALVKLFLWVADNRYDGDLSGKTAEDIEICVDWKGDDGQFVNALSEVGFLDGESGSYRVHDWATWNPFAASRAERVERARQNASKRHKHGKQVASDSQASGKPDDSQASAHHTTPHHTPKAKTKPSRDTRESDPRFQSAKTFIERCYKHAGCEFFWDGSDAKQLSLTLAAGPGLDDQALTQLIQNRFRSKEPPGRRAREWLPHLPSYASGPLDRFNKQEELGNGKDHVADRESGVIASVQEFARSRTRDLDSSGTGKARAALGENAGKVSSAAAGSTTG